MEILNGLEFCKLHSIVKKLEKTLDHQIEEWSDFNQKKEGFAIENNGKKVNDKIVRKVSNGIIRHSALELQKAKEEFKNLGFKMCSFEDFCDARN